MRSSTNTHRRPASTFAPGDLVWLSARNIRLHFESTKFAPRYVGPFKVLEQVNPVVYRLALPPRLGITDTFHVSLLKSVYMSRFSEPSAGTSGSSMNDYELLPLKPVLGSGEQMLLGLSPSFPLLSMPRARSPVGDRGSHAQILQQIPLVLQEGPEGSQLLLSEHPDFRNPPLMCTSRQNNIRDKVVRADVGSCKSTLTRTLTGEKRTGIFPCLNCISCSNIIKGNEVVIEKVPRPHRDGNHIQILKQRETYCIYTLDTLHPKDLNQEIDWLTVIVIKAILWPNRYIACRSSPLNKLFT
ncbi:unnamed protein product [Ranitomeya imitator]|uniref:Tf2-1-like SH3-like domain-containing protein n=1 Tax=Ranitomeya imitator TaxID=111125 RepID=A0ABN9MGB0_9NEOB|nr:unnamed protein product [Ranitomeya imitator]